MRSSKILQFEPIRYPIQLNKDGYCGNAIIFVMSQHNKGISDRAYNEGENLSKFAKMLSLKPYIFQNAKSKEIQEALSYITKPPKDPPTCIPENVRQARIKQEHKAIMIAVVSHGNRDSFLTADEEVFPDREIDSYLNEKNCPLMRGKPKIIFFNKCRTGGEDVDETLSTLPTSKSPVFDFISRTGHENIFNGSSTFSNFLHIHSWSMGTTSFRNKPTGSPILSALPDEYELYGRDKEFREFIQLFRSRMIKEVDKKVQNDPELANVTQCITTDDSLLGDIYFPQARPVAGQSDCESLEEMEVDRTFDLNVGKELWEFSNHSDDEMDIESVKTETLPKIHQVKRRFSWRMKMYKKAHHTFKPGGYNNRIMRMFSLN